MLCGFGAEIVGGRLPFVVHPAVIPRLQSIAQRLGIPAPTTGVPEPLPATTSAPAHQAPTATMEPGGIEPVLLSALAALQQSNEDQQQQLNPTAKAAFLALLLHQQQQQLRNLLLPSLSLVDVSAGTTSNDNNPGDIAQPMDFSPIVNAQPQKLTAPEDAGSDNNAKSAGFLVPSSSSSPVMNATNKDGDKTNERTPHRRGGRSNNQQQQQLGDNTNAAMIVHGEPIECIPAYAKLANARWSQKQNAALQHQHSSNNNNNSLNNSDDMTVGPSPNTPGCIHVCIFCGKRYSRKYGLKIHLRTHTGYRPLECRYCHRRFGDPSNLNKHLRLHAQVESPFVCRFCGKSLVRRRDLDRHLRSRHPGLLASTAPNGQQTALSSNNPSATTSINTSPSSAGTTATPTTPATALMTPPSSTSLQRSNDTTTSQTAVVFPSRSGSSERDFLWHHAAGTISPSSTASPSSPADE